MSDLRGMTKLERWCAEKPVDAADRIERLEAELRDANFKGYMAGVGDSEALLDMKQDAIDAAMQILAALEGGDE